jgi:hypothetical protein
MDRKLAIFEDVKMFLEEKGRFPTWKEIETDIGVPRRTIRRYFNTYQELMDQILSSGEVLFTEERAKSVKDVVKKHKRFIVTTAVAGAPVFTDALKAVKNYCKRKEAALLITPCSDPAANMSEGLGELVNENIVFENTDLNSNIAIYALKLSAKQINPITGLGRIGQRNKSFIFASPKQSLEYVPVGNNRLPHALMSTGAITLPDYNTDRYMSKRTAFIAEHDHVLGGIIVEIDGKDIYHFRTIEFNSDGSFTDMGTRFYADGKCKKFPVKNLTLGDWHCGHTEPTVKESTMKLIEMLSPENLTLHDVFQGDSVNHHVLKKVITRSQINKPSILEEGKILKDDLEKFHKLVPNIHIVKSNHDEWLDRYLEEGSYPFDSLNFETSHILALAKKNGIDPLKKLMELCQLKAPVNFNKRDQDLVFCGVQYGCHGDFMHKGMSYSQLERAYAKATAGHRHTAGILRGVRFVGTSTKLRESYATGPISWTNTHEILNEDGSRQLINIINGRYCLC